MQLNKYFFGPNKYQALCSRLELQLSLGHSSFFIELSV